ncbi:PTS system mannose/fructose/N-acetylgalactosamine-transporter subunit IIB [Dellaglioa algida]|uniref:PTS system mannose/fructose/N-acetylgalactosamine-transporter subunit IIB n=1 Tax=Dellaglioa algida TaxID=105612 RepID=UPI0024C49E62|nr:PTS sugar transporter subunit IIB [Dellaglioa algida]MDK1728462.1 PTS sugar transporter subunit IIB [Dellaglioa algida]MDK1736134.1 PTS sugar transporter subunit IIB [Dellaglioa algida]MDK1737827.1 PTS sugar transporter subunit IIB [Dellaglioa algida]
MAISFIRIDDRIIHGQVVTRWLSEVKVDGVVAVDDAAANDPIISKVLKGAVPSGLKGFVMPVERVLKRWEDIVESDKQYFLVAKSPVTLMNLYKGGADFIKEHTEINVGPMSEREGAKKVGPNANITQEEFEAFKFLNDQGADVYFQLVPDSKKTKFAEASINFNK